jgi:hypothetical protein
MDFNTFPSIELFHNVVRTTEVAPELISGPVAYRGKIKLHGTCAGITFGDGQILPMSKSQFLSIGNDNSGFARWLEENKTDWQSLALDGWVVYGEWCGKGIQGGTAISEIDKKVFAIFAVMEIATKNFIVKPEVIRGLFNVLPKDTYVLPWYGEPFTIDFSDRSALQSKADDLNSIVNSIEPSDPWVKETFGKDGVCEGVVYYPNWNGNPGIASDLISTEFFTNFAFKAKGEKHRVKKAKEAVQIAPEVAKSVSEFVAMFVTDQR